MHAAELRSGSSRLFFQLILSGFVLAASLSSPAIAQDILYRETFGRPDPAAGNISTIMFDWMRFNAAGAVQTGANGVSSDSTGKPIDLANTDSAGPVIGGTLGPFAEGWSYMDGTQVLSMTTEFSFDPSANSPVTFKWWQGANNAAGGGLNDARVVVRVGGVWYASAAIFANTPSVPAGTAFGNPETDPTAPGASPMMMAYDNAAANWLTLNFTGDYDPATDTGTASTAISVGAAAAGPLVGNITAFGFYRAVTGQNFRFDNFTIEGKGLNPGDVDKDDDVDLIDFGLIRDHFRQTVNMRELGDLNGDNTVDFLDYRRWKANYPFPFTPNWDAVPEPAAGVMGLLAAAAATAIARSRSQKS